MSLSSLDDSDPIYPDDSEIRRACLNLPLDVF